jgi:hypothetical protein
LDFIGQFTSDIRYIAGSDNVAADALSRVEKLETSIDYQVLAASQEQDQEIRELRQGASSLQLK